MLLPLMAVATTQADNILAGTENNTPLTKSDGDDAYEMKHYDKAIAIYEALINDEGATKQLHYNLGNAYYRANEIGKAILNYERALRLDPTDDAIKANLEFAQDYIKDEITEQPEMFLATWFHGVTNTFGVDGWAVIAVTAFIIALVGIAVLLMVKKNGIRRAGLIISIIAVVVSLFANIAAMSLYNFVTDKSQAIVIKEEVTMMSAPGSSTALIRIHEGRKVTVIDDTIENWKEIQLEDGTVGWVKRGDIELI